MKINTIPLRTSLGLSIIIMGVLTIVLVFFSGVIYREHAIENQRSALVKLVGIEVEGLLENLEDNAAQLGLDIQHDGQFRNKYKNSEWRELQDLLDNRFHQYFVTAGVLKLEKIQVLDQDFRLVAESSSGGLPSNLAGNCPGTSDKAAQRTGVTRLKPFRELCASGNTPYLFVTVPVGLRPDGYIRVVTDPTHDLIQLESEFEMPLRLSNIDDQTIYATNSWEDSIAKSSSLVIDYPLVSVSSVHVATASLLIDVGAFLDDLSRARLLIMLVVVIMTTITVLLVRMLSERLILKPLQSLCAMLRRSDDNKIACITPADHGIISEFRELKELYSTLQGMAMTDPLTGLANRTQFESRLEAINSDPGNGEDQHSICFIDLDRFKIVNDTYGHAAGDSLLRQIVHLFKDNIRNKDLVARLGGDEFALLMMNCSQQQAGSIAGKLCKAVANHRFPWGRQLLNVGVSIGVVSFRPTAHRMSDLVNAADTACYIAKKNGRNRIHAISSDDIILNRERSEIRWDTRIIQAMDEGQFELFSQPIVPCADRQGTSQFREIFLVMYDEDGKHITPAKFIPAAGKYGLMIEIDKWVIRKLFAELDSFQAKGVRDLPVFSINLSAQSISDDKFLHFLIDILDTTNIPNENICFEITESSAIVNLIKSIRFISILRGMGIRFSLDDFGTGLSSFNYLRNLNVDYVKIDRSLVRGMNLNEVDSKAVRAINRLAQGIGMMTIAEAVENEATWKMLKDIGVNLAQGYFIGKPIPLRDTLHMPLRVVINE
jgi:diguanylate cyclase (GGDEF)-like protein